MTDKPAGQAARERRRSLLWSVRRLARETALSPALISQFENGKAAPSRRSMSRIEWALRMPEGYLLMLAGFIPREDYERAQQMAEKAMQVPEMVAVARGDTDQERLEWLTSDYLLLIGHDLTGKLGEDRPNMHMANWQLVDPEAPESELIRSIEEFKATMHRPKPSPQPIEGWDELTDTDRLFIQQMVNKLRQRSDDE